MKNILDNLSQLRYLDRSNMLGSIESLGQQIEQSLRETRLIKIPKSYQRVNNIVLNGMGGSGLPGHLIQSLFYRQLKIPLHVIHSYRVPEYVNQKTLYIVSSYSGTTEEPLATLPVALERKAKVLGLTSGAHLAFLMRKYKIPGYIFGTEFNPSGQPRMGIGYSVFGFLGLLRQIGLVNLSNQEAKAISEELKDHQRQFNLLKKTKDNPAKKIAQSFFGHLPVIVAAEFLAGNAHLFRNQLHENSKSFANYFEIPELNHHLMEGLSFPRKAKRFLRFLFLESDQYLPKNQKRYKVTKRVLDKKRVSFVYYRARAKRRLSQSVEIMLLGGYVSFYLAMLNQVDPSPVPWVDFFKKALKKK